MYAFAALTVSSHAGRFRLHLARRHGRERVARFEPHLHVGEPMLEVLVRRERTSERVAVEHPLEREVEHRLRRRRRSRRFAITIASWSWRSTSASACPGAPTAADAGTRTPSSSTRAYRRTRSRLCERRDREAGGVGRNEELREAVVGACGDEQLLGLRARLDRRLDARQHEAVAVGGGADRDVTEAVVRCGLGDGPGGDDLTGDDRGEYAALLLVGARAGQRGSHHVRGEQAGRARRWRRTRRRRGSGRRHPSR